MSNYYYTNASSTVIQRSEGVHGNPKRICALEEIRDKPLAIKLGTHRIVRVGHPGQARAPNNHVEKYQHE